MAIHNEVYTDYEGFGFYNEPSPGHEPDTSLYHFVFHFNAYSGLWAAIPRDVYQQYWSDRNIPGVISSRSIETLIALLHKTKGDPEKIEKLTRE